MNITKINIWALSKHKTIKLLLFQLQEQLAQGNFSVEDTGCKEYYEVSLVKPDQPEVRAYVYIYGQLKDLYGIHLEYPFNSENEYSNSSPFYEDLTLQQVIKILASHFDVQGYEMAI
jgi:hypothetical protein